MGQIKQLVDQQQRSPPQFNQLLNGVQPSAPPLMSVPGRQFQPQTIPIEPVSFPPQGAETNVIMNSNQHVNVMYQQQTQGLPQTLIYQHQFASSHETTCQAPPKYVTMPPYQVLSATPGRIEGWKTGLFDCMDDPANALITACFPCVTFGQVAEIVDEGSTSCFIAVPCILSCAYRTKLRKKFGLVESPAPDWVIHCFCDLCALCQEYRELQRRGWDPSIGWYGNVARMQSTQQQQLVMMAPINQTMMRR
ncbi:hypothetical protein COLO4_16275 [Corchorus olitorius]|uniref:PLAC8 motif-containing protein n=1 Tax=Corchorus olitorius TaxID=93759 RepID=A0A1R3JIK0_9ROSI|nr:hypothetical protein COLO4_16275 [Corchorus olitorius]